MQNNYELVIIFKVSEAEDKIKKTLEEVTKIISSAGKILKSTDWGKKIFAYPVKKEKEGKYYFLEISTEGNVVAQLKDKFRLNESVLRYLFIKVPVIKKKKQEKQDKK